MMTLPPSMGEMKLSCFSAVMPVIGWNQWVKWVAPFSMAQSFIALATMLAASLSSRTPSLIEHWTCLNTFLGRRALMTESLNTIEPKISVTGFMSRPPFFNKNIGSC